MRKALVLTALALQFGLVAPAMFGQRIPDFAPPKHYQLTISPDFASETFTGDEAIQIDLLKPSASITLNAAEIKFTEVTVSSGGKIQTAQVTSDEKNEMATFTVEDRLAVGPAEIHIRYTGILNGQLRGFYLSKANDRKYAITQLENTDARRMYPSFDEPSYKATFDITAIIDKGGRGRPVVAGAARRGRNNAVRILRAAALCKGWCAQPNRAERDQHRDKSHNHSVWLTATVNWVFACDPMPFQAPAIQRQAHLTSSRRVRATHPRR